MVDQARSGFGKVTRTGDKNSKKIAKRLFEERRIQIRPEALRSAEPEVSKHFGKRLARVEQQVIEFAGRFPPKLLSHIESTKGDILVTHEIRARVRGRVRYPQGAYHRDRNLIEVTTEALMQDRGVFEEEIIHLVDHLLGSAGEGRNLSEGVFVKPALEEMADEIGRFWNDKDVDLGEDSMINQREFIAAAIRFYLTDPEVLREIYPELYNHVNGRWFNNAFWESVL